MRNASHPCLARCGRLRPTARHDFCRACFARLPADLVARMRAAWASRNAVRCAEAAKVAGAWLLANPEGVARGGSGA